MQAGVTWAQSSPGLELFFQDKPMTLARWPNEGFVKIVDRARVHTGGVHGTTGDKDGISPTTGDRPKRWTGAKDVCFTAIGSGTGPTSDRKSSQSTPPSASSP